MGRRRSVAVGERRLEYDYEREYLRLVGADEEIDIPIEALHALHVNLGGRRWLLFGGRRFRGGSRDLVGVYRSESDACAAFHDLRQRMDGDGWGEVLVLDENGKRQQRFWFDTERPETATAATGATRRWGRKS